MCLSFDEDVLEDGGASQLLVEKESLVVVALTFPCGWRDPGSLGYGG